MSYLKDLEEKGYCVVENVLTPEEVSRALELFREWLESNEKMKTIHELVSPHGIYKHFEVGHQAHAWFIRTRDAVQAPFRKLWGKDDLVVSFDGSCWMKPEWKKNTGTWTHTDQAPSKKGPQCYQAFVSLTENKEKTFQVYEGSHLLHETYMKECGLTHSKNWQKIDPAYLKTIEDRKRAVHVKPGDLVIWDSRTFHQNQYGDRACGEERIVQYVSFLPRAGMTKAMEKKRWKYFEERRTTSHWAYPVHVNAKQPRTYGNEKLVIDYASLKKPALEEYMPLIKKLI